MEVKMSANKMFILLAQTCATQACAETHHDECLHTSSSSSSSTQNLQKENLQLNTRNMQHLVQLWHRRYGHLNYTSLRALQSKGMVKGLPAMTVTEELCSECITGKHHREPISRKSFSGGQAKC